MSNDRAKPGAGDVEIMLDGEKKVLRPTLAAAMAISRMNGGLAGAISRVASLDMDTMVGVVRAGLDLTDLGAKGLDEKVFRSGLGFEDGLSAPLQTYLSHLANGVRPRKAGGAHDSDNPPKSA